MIEIEANKGDGLIAATGQRKKSPAVAVALDEFLENRRRQEFLDRGLKGKTDYRASNEEVAALAKLKRSAR